MHTRNVFSLAILLFVSLGTADPASAEGLVSEGQRLAKKWCAECHIVSEDQTTALADAPSFKFIASRYENSLGALGAFLTDPHPIMPSVSLTRREIQDLLAYIDSLK